ncbi:MAG: FimV/HubP family polar landmark protein [Gammaproteobacteria bacterium]
MGGDAGDAADVTSPSEHRSQQPSHDQDAFVEGEVSQAPWSAYRDSAERAQNEASTPSEGIEEAQAGHGPSLTSSEHVGSTPPEEELEVENVAQHVTMSNTVELPQDAFATGREEASAAGENDFVVIADLTAPEEVVVLDLTDSEKTQEIDDIPESDRFAKTVRLPHAFPAAAGEPSDLDTKLNLAKAYIELGDPKGAREILDEVAHSGSDVQKQNAETLRRQLG